MSQSLFQARWKNAEDAKTKAAGAENTKRLTSNKKGEKMTKICRRCQQELPESEFNKKARLKDGLDSYCRQCANRYTRESKAKNSEPYHLGKPRSKGRPQKIRDREYYYAHPERHVAKRKVRVEVIEGRLPDPRSVKCKMCGGQARDYHHPDYSKPLDVIPLCRSCHKKIHQTKSPVSFDRNTGLQIHSLSKE